MRKLLAASAVALLTLLSATSGARADSQAEPPSSADWDQVADCASTSRWDANTGNGYEGGLQILPDTWELFGGHEFSEHGYEATPGQQKIVAGRIWSIEGWEAWPNCARLLGFLDRDVTGSTIQGVDEDDPNIDVTSSTSADTSATTSADTTGDTTGGTTGDTTAGTTGDTTAGTVDTTGGTAASLGTSSDDPTTSESPTSEDPSGTTAGAAVTDSTDATTGGQSSGSDSDSIVPLLLGVIALAIIVAILFTVLAKPKRKPPVFDPGLFETPPLAAPASENASSIAERAAEATARSVPAATVTAVSTTDGQQPDSPVLGVAPAGFSAVEAVAVDGPTIIAPPAPPAPAPSPTERAASLAAISTRPAPTLARTEFFSDLEQRASHAFTEAHGLATEASILRVRAEEIRARQDISRSRAARLEQAARAAEDQGRPSHGRAAAVADAIEEVSNQRSEVARLTSEADRLDQLQQTARRRGARLLERSRSL